MSSSAALSHPVSPENPKKETWDEAFLRVESYLHAHHLEGRVLLNQWATAIIGEARERVEAGWGGEPVAVAMQIAQEKIGAWFKGAGHAGDWSDERVRARGRLALVLADVPGRWAHCFLSPEPLPPPLATALTASVIRPGPELRFTNMAPAPLEFGFEEASKTESSPRNAGLILRMAAIWLAIIGLYGAAWAAAH